MMAAEPEEVHLGNLAPLLGKRPGPFKRVAHGMGTLLGAVSKKVPVRLNHSVRAVTTQRDRVQGVEGVDAEGSAFAERADIVVVATTARSSAKLLDGWPSTRRDVERRPPSIRRGGGALCRRRFSARSERLVRGHGRRRAASPSTIDSRWRRSPALPRAPPWPAHRSKTSSESARVSFETSAAHWARGSRSSAISGCLGSAFMATCIIAWLSHCGRPATRFTASPSPAITVAATPSRHAWSRHARLPSAPSRESSDEECRLRKRR